MTLAGVSIPCRRRRSEVSGPGCRMEGPWIDVRVTRKRSHHPERRRNHDHNPVPFHQRRRPPVRWNARDDPLDQLSPRELEVLALMAEGRSNRAIGEQLAVELKTVETHVSRVFTKLGLDENRL